MIFAKLNGKGWREREVFWSAMREQNTRDSGTWNTPDTKIITLSGSTVPALPPASRIRIPYTISRSWVAIRTMLGYNSNYMFSYAMRSVRTLALHDAIAYVEEVERTRGVGLFIPGDLHLWGADGGNRSDLFAYLLEVLPYRKVALLGDMFDGTLYERETDADRDVLHRLRVLDDDARLHILRGNHDRGLMSAPGDVRMRGCAVGADVFRPDMQWLSRPRPHEDVWYAEVQGVTYTSPRGGGNSTNSSAHMGTSDVTVLRVGDGLVYLEHGDRYDAMIGAVHNNPVLERISKQVYDTLLRIEQWHSDIGHTSRFLKQQMSVLRGVCGAVAQGARSAVLQLEVGVTGTISGHTHYPLYRYVLGLPHVNVGSFRGLRPSFALVAGDTGEVLPPVVIRLD